jgi:hypothetical protein
MEHAHGLGPLEQVQRGRLRAGVVGPSFRFAQPRHQALRG